MFIVLELILALSTPERPAWRRERVKDADVMVVE
jgi:hypothetical protein